MTTHQPEARARSVTDTPFFRGVRQVDLPVREGWGKSPMFFADARAIGAVFPVDAAAARALLPDPLLEPAVFAPGRALLTVCAFEYGFSDLGPYREVFVALAVERGRSLVPGPLRLIASLARRRLDAHIVQLPVDSELARAGGIDYYNVPKYLATIELTRSGARQVCRVSDATSRELIFELGGPSPSLRQRLPGSPLARMVLRNHTVLEGRLTEARFELHLPRSAVRLGAPGATLTHGQHGRAALFQALRPGAAACYFVAEKGEAILYPPG